MSPRTAVEQRVIAIEAQNKADTLAIAARAAAAEAAEAWVECRKLGGTIFSGEARRMTRQSKQAEADRDRFGQPHFGHDDKADR